MKLTKAMREEFVASVMSGIPIEHHYNSDDAESEIIKAVEMQLPNDMLNFVKNYPDLVLRNKRMEFKDLKYRNWRDQVCYTSIYVIDHESCKPIDVSQWIEKQQKHDAEKQRRAELQRRLSEITKACTTLAKLKVALPELESYMPTEVVKRDLPIASGTVITDLMQLGLKVPK